MKDPIFSFQELSAHDLKEILLNIRRLIKKNMVGKEQYERAAAHLRVVRFYQGKSRILQGGNSRWISAR